MSAIISLIILRSLTTEKYQNNAMCLAKNELPSKKKIQLTVNEQLEKKDQTCQALINHLVNLTVNSRLYGEEGQTIILNY